MGPCRILEDSVVHDVLMNFSREDILEFLESLAECLVGFSLSEERQYQPPPGVINRPNGQKTLFRPFTSPTSVGTKIIVDPAPTSKGEKLPLRGILAICDETGAPSGLINAEEVTGFRTSLSAIVPFMWRHTTQNIVVFGAGKQALWHLRLGLGLRGSEVQSITVVNRNATRARNLLETIEAENQQRPNDDVVNASSEADVIFCTVPSTRPLFAAGHIINRSRQKGPPLITAIGSWQPDMIELDTALLQAVVEDQHACNPTGAEGGVVIVDDREGALQHAGDIVQGKLESRHLVELGELLGLRRGKEVWSKPCPEKQLTQWLSQGLVIYKSIGVSVTDLAAGNAILRHAQQRQLGIVMPDS